MPITLNGDTGITTPSYGGADTAEYLVPVTSMKNRIINGAMSLNQRALGTVTVNSSGLYTVDRWQANQTAAGKFSVQQSSIAPAGFTNSYLATSLSSYSVGSSDIFFFAQQLEGYNVADLAWGTANAKTVTLSFWVRSSLTGTFGGVLTNSSGNRSYPFSYTINSADTWEYETITVTGDTSGTWLTDNGIGISLIFGLGGGASRSGTAGSWSGSNFYTATGATSVVGTNGATFYITGVQLEAGTNATSFDYRPYGTELALCERYYQKLGNFYFSAYNTTGEPTGCAITFKTEMRTTPTVAYGSISGTNYYGTTIDDITTSSYRAYSLASGNGRLFFGMGNVTGSAEL